MRKIVVIIGVVIAFILTSIAVLRVYTTTHSPIDIAEYSSDKIDMDVVYCQPYKKGRTIFGDLVPFDTLWRTGANDATVITLSDDVTILNNTLPEGSYSLWTIPGEKEWTIIFNKEVGQWGVKVGNMANIDESQDQLRVVVPSYLGNKEIEQFTIEFEQMEDEIDMIMMWDKTVVVVPIKTIP